MAAGHITVDECGRIWRIINNFGIHIYDSTGTLVGSWNMNVGWNPYWDLFLADNYVLILTQANTQLVYYYDPKLTC